jgi:hypothetical protein
MAYEAMFATPSLAGLRGAREGGEVATFACLVLGGCRCGGREMRILLGFAKGQRILCKSNSYANYANSSYNRWISIR